MARPPKEFNAACKWLTALLKDHKPVSVESIEKEMRERGTSWRTLLRAKAALNISSWSAGTSVFGNSWKSAWSLPKGYRTAVGRARVKAKRIDGQKRRAYDELMRAMRRYDKFDLPDASRPALPS